MKYFSIFIILVFIFSSCTNENKILENKTFYETELNGEYIKSNKVSFKFFKESGGLNIFWKEYNDDGELRKFFEFGNIPFIINKKIDLFKYSYNTENFEAFASLATRWSDGDLPGESFYITSKEDSWIELTSYSDGFLEGVAEFTLVVDTSITGRIYPEIPDTLRYRNFKFKAYEVE